MDVFIPVFLLTLACYLMYAAITMKVDATKFGPKILYNEKHRATEIILRDTAITWQPWAGPYKDYTDHAVDLGYDTLGNLAGVRVWDDIRKRKWGW